MFPSCREEAARYLGSDEYDLTTLSAWLLWAGEDAWKDLPASRRAAIAARMPTVSAHFTALSNSPLRLAHLPSLRMPMLHLSGETSPAPMRRLEFRLREAMHGADAQRPDNNALDALAVERFFHLGSASLLGRPACKEHAESAGVEPPQGEGKCLRRRTVEPLDVVDRK